MVICKRLGFKSNSIAKKPIKLWEKVFFSLHKKQSECLMWMARQIQIPANQSKMFLYSCKSLFFTYCLIVCIEGGPWRCRQKNLMFDLRVHAVAIVRVIFEKERNWSWNGRCLFQASVHICIHDLMCMCSYMRVCVCGLCKYILCVHPKCVCIQRTPCVDCIFFCWKHISPFAHHFGLIRHVTLSVSYCYDICFHPWHKNALRPLSCRWKCFAIFTYNRL